MSDTITLKLIRSGETTIEVDRAEYCASGVVWQADHAAAINILRRHGDPDITLHTPYKRVKQILQERTDRQRIRLPIQDSSPNIRAESETSESMLRCEQ